MKQIFVFCSAIIVLTSFSYQKNDEREYYETGELKSELIFDSICNCKHYTEYYKNGEKKATATYLNSDAINSRIDGAEIHYFENGTVALYTFWHKGKPDGRQYANFIDGKLGYERFYKDGFKDSTWQYYNEDGSLRERQQYAPNKTMANSELDFVENEFFMDNKLVYTEKIADGKRVDIEIADGQAYDRMQMALADKGQRLFITNCAQCHSIETDIVGPKLKGIIQRRTNGWVKAMIVNGDSLMAQNDPIAVALYNQWQNVQHPDFRRLTPSDIDEIISYIGKYK